MRVLPNLVCCLAAVALMALGCLGGAAAQSQRPPSIAQASDADGDDADGDMPRRRGTAEEPEASDDAPEPAARMGGSGGGLDIFDAADDRPSATPNQRPDVVVCVAGCEGARGAVVYKKPN
jgi:hypothetical protein